MQISGGGGGGGGAIVCLPEEEKLEMRNVRPSAAPCGRGGKRNDLDKKNHMLACGERPTTRAGKTSDDLLLVAPEGWAKHIFEKTVVFKY